MNPISPTQTERAVAVGVFDGESSAREATVRLRSAGFADDQMTLISTFAAEVRQALLDLGVPEGEVRFYTDELEQGRSVLVVAAAGNYDEARQLLLAQGAYDVQSRGAELVRGDAGSEPAASRGRSTPPLDETTRWEDVRSRYEMLFGQHYGTRGSWEESEPLYRHAWQLANDPRYRGRPWSEVGPLLEREWTSQRRTPAWEDAAGPVRDVFEDVADEARMGLEGGAEFRTRKPLE